MITEEIIEQIRKYVHKHQKSIHPKGRLPGASHGALLEYLQTLDNEMDMESLNIALDKMEATGQISHRNAHLIEFNFK